MTQKYKYFTKENLPSLEEVLDNRENRISLIKDLQDEYPSSSVVCFKLNIPGEQKINDAVLKIFNLGIDEINSVLNDKILYKEVKKNITGPEYFLVVDDDQLKIKKSMVDLEENSHFGRLYDIDVIYHGENITRDMIGIGQRKCFMCDDDAKVCARSRKHSLDDMITWIETLIDSYEGDLWEIGK